ncbi:MAG: DUF2252 domain-containing protein [Actinobacteria bacterium]|nr:DUF2252 domain-containing protein [Actinomycetota bacterium]
MQYLVPIRHWRMAQSPFTFYRGGAKIMAQDLSTTPATGLNAQLCGDAHLSNFGVYGSPSRQLVFDVNDFDETLPGPWEWDLKRLAASFAIVARHNNYKSKDEADLAALSVASYRDAMAKFAGARYLDMWYSELNVAKIQAAFGDQLTKKEAKSGKKFAKKARSKNSVHAFDKLAEETDDGFRIMSQPPLIVPLRDIPTKEDPEDIKRHVTEQLTAYLDSVPEHLQALLSRFAYRDAALKVVGVGSVGTNCNVVLFKGRDSTEPFFLQIKEAMQSVLADHLPASKYEHEGERVVVGQRLMQAASDVFLGWTTGSTGRYYYWRQFKDMKGSVEVDGAPLKRMRRYAQLCGWTLARSHARSGDSQAIAGYLGSGDVFDRAIADFAVAYADQNDSDYKAFKAAIDSGQISAHEG